MKKYNLEQQLAEKLGNRSISPSDNAWERIAFNRQQQAGKKSRKKRSLYWVAASVAVLLMGGYLVIAVLSTPISTNATPQVVQGKDAVQKLPVTNMVKQSQVAHAVMEPKHPEQKAGNTLPVIEPKKYKDAENELVKISNNAPLQLAPTEVALPEADIKAAGTVIAAARPQEDVLLEKAMRDVAAQKQFKQTTNQEALLKEVESEMDEYYREKALRFFSLKYKKIRIVVKDNH